MREFFCVRHSPKNGSPNRRTPENMHPEAPDSGVPKPSLVLQFFLADERR